MNTQENSFKFTDDTVKVFLKKIDLEKTEELVNFYTSPILDREHPPHFLISEDVVYIPITELVIMKGHKMYQISPEILFNALILSGQQRQALENKSV